MTGESDAESGRVLSLNISAGGVPKRAMRGIAIEFDGVVGDSQADRKHHGGPERAVCLYSAELIEALSAEGHPVGAGTAGENVTIAGLDWALVVPGVRLTLGSAEVEVTSFTSPCKTISGSFLEGFFMRISQAKNPGWSRVYARVLVCGYVTIGDTVALKSRGVAHSLP